jgi:hypothetical protein
MFHNVIDQANGCTIAAVVEIKEKYRLKPMEDKP